MGYQSAVSFIEEAPTLEVALTWHLQSNHYPPLPTSLIPTCIAAIDAFQDEDYERAIELPEGIFWKGQKEAPASAIVDGHNLDAFLDGQ